MSLLRYHNIALTELKENYIIKFYHNIAPAELLKKAP